MKRKENYMISEVYAEHCMDEFYDIDHNDIESELQYFLDSELNKATYLDALLTFDFLINLCEKDYKDFFEKAKLEYKSQLSLELDQNEIRELYTEYNEYFTDYLDKYENINIQVTHCNCCGKPSYRGENAKTHLTENQKQSLYDEMYKLLKTHEDDRLTDMQLETFESIYLKKTKKAIFRG